MFTQRKYRGFVGEYIGEIILNAQADERLKLLGEPDPCYILMFKEHTLLSSSLVICMILPYTHTLGILSVFLWTRHSGGTGDTVS